MDPTQLPRYLRSLADFRAYLDDEFSSETSPSKGNRFVNAMLQLLPHLPQAQGFESFELSPTVSHDGGVDISSRQNADGSVLRVQSRYKLERVDDLDSILSKFEDYDQISIDEDAGVLPLTFEGNGRPAMPVYMVLTSSDVSNIAAIYESKGRSSLRFYKRLKSEGRLHLVGGQAILDTLRHRFVKSSRLPNSLTLTSPKGWLRVGDVYLGVVRGPDMVELFDQHGDGLFFENIREWLGLEEGRVNASITATVVDEPGRMLERNNGITIRGEAVRQTDNNTLVADRAAIINGCQTTMCIWHARPTDTELLVQIKVVQTPANEDAWTIARSSNYQNDVSQIDLELAKYLRPQLVSRAAASQGRGLESARDDSLPNLLAQLTETEVSFALTKYVFLGLFCAPPNQLFNDNYSKVRMDVLKALYASDADVEDRLFATIFDAVEAGRNANEEAKDAYKDEAYVSLYQRLLDSTKHKYSAYLILLAAAGALKFDLSQRESDPETEAARIDGFLSDLGSLLRERKNEFTEAYLIAFKVYAASTDRSQEGDEKTAQRLSVRLQESSFSNLFRQIRMELDALSHILERRAKE
ncbi:hypothetical protein VV01_20255 [Luteipulveratus halotolerans]|uniref:Abortive phage infection protein C-terminal domain-containing protein n=1 Tax=Luteipulveratus halotolerans TaxID=1631356 RepID=A0A0L6CMJ1_9MICO|nr:hypothetical protein VV01_20255 [Luteipulveratus halotolerans]